MAKALQTRQDNRLIIENLIDKIEKRECALFVGPGASLPEAGYLGPPGPATLAAEIVEKLDYTPSDIRLSWVAQLYKNPRALRAFVAERLGDHRYRPTSIHHLIASLPFDIIVSTAYDRLLDDLLEKQKPALKIVLEDSDLPPPGHPQLIKLYGRVDPESSLRVTEEDLETLFERLPRVATRLKDISGTYTLLFVGYYLGDATFRRLFVDLRRKLGSVLQACIIHPDPEQAEENYWKDEGLKTIPDEPKAFLAGLREELAHRKGEPPPPAPQPAYPPRLGEDTIRKRLRLVNQVLKDVGISGVVESGLQLRSAEHNLDFARQLLSEHAQLGGAAPPTDSSVIATQAQILLQYGNAEWAQYNYDQAQQHFEDALKLAPDLLEAYFSLHYLQAERGTLDMALDMYRHVLAIAPERALLPPRYEIQAVLGTGNLGIVYRVKDTQTDKLLSVTMLRSVFSRDEKTLERFKSALALLQHPRIPCFIPLGPHRGRHFIVREYIDGQPLSHRLCGQPLPMAEAFFILDQVAETLEYAHGCDRPHLSLNPSSILLASEGGVKLINLGEADLTIPRLRLPGSDIKAADYLSPEQRAGDPGDERSDIYALGTIAYEMFTGHLPGEGEVKRPSQENPDADEALDVLVDRARARDPRHRFPAIDQMHREIQRIAQISRPGWKYVLTDSIRWLLRQVSRGLARLRKPTRVVVLVLLLLLAGLAEVWCPLPQLRIATRLLLLLSVNVIPASLLCYWQVRETAHRTGLGSLIHSGRGMGGVFGVVMSLWDLWKTRWDNAARPGWGNPAGLNRLAPAPSSDFLAFIFVAPLLTFGLTYVMLLVVDLGGRLTQKYWQRYTDGFYVTFLLWCMFFSLQIAWPRLFYGLLEVPG